MDNKKFIFEDLSRVVIGCFFHVHNSIGTGFDEKTYHYWDLMFN